MQIVYYNSTSDPRCLTKDITQISAGQISLKDDTEIINPTILTSAVLPPKANYAYIPTLGRYYYIDGQTITIGKLLSYQLRCDVLMSHKDSILGSYVIANRSTSKPNKSLVDIIPISSSRNLIYKLMHNGSTVFGSDKVANDTRCYLLTVATGGF